MRKSSTTLNYHQSRPTANNLSSYSTHAQTTLLSAHTVALNTPSLMPLCASGSFCPYLGSESGSGSGSSSARGIQKDRFRDKDKEKDKGMEETKDRGYAGGCMRGNQEDRVGSSESGRVGCSDRGNRVAWGTPRTSPTGAAIINSDNKYDSMSSDGSSDVAHNEEDRLIRAHAEAHTQERTQYTQVHTQHAEPIQGHTLTQGQLQVTREIILNFKSTEEDESIWTDDSNSQLVRSQTVEHATRRKKMLLFCIFLCVFATSSKHVLVITAGLFLCVMTVILNTHPYPDCS